MEDIVLQKIPEDERRYPPLVTRSNNSSFVHDLRLLFQIQNSNGDGFLFQINKCGCHKDTFLGYLARKVSYGISKLSRNFGNSLDNTF
ncbi:hypothetical protein AVEN_149639-1 [Araneus ventricosus]|uniref:Uncharacterized protein n=1 Tax=Araneus ventricosus TaxID=182803 RepID=A0A4Y2C597_ARAVE|nr:hypothetical protein AVEN_227619-1 [Araneus ventricosus]GBL99632.1 hypothetical protein AVEN_238257-1 [Araneus ventricosus]GBL99650.1 hypothetical protein AVEN_105625-1 [Araneus ventricosus]GBL99664.1 hypothetical protein AVEN_149639-1 [Araneus ventricosus]